MDDVAEYNDMRNAMNVIGISPEVFHFYFHFLYLLLSFPHSFILLDFLLFFISLPLSGAIGNL